MANNGPFPLLRPANFLNRVAPTFVLKYNIRAVRALGAARSDLAGLDEVVEGGVGDVQDLGDGGVQEKVKWGLFATVNDYSIQNIV